MQLWKGCCASIHDDRLIPEGGALNASFFEINWRIFQFTRAVMCNFKTQIGFQPYKSAVLKRSGVSLMALKTI